MNSFIYRRELNIVAKPGAKGAATRPIRDATAGLAMQPFARPSIFRHGLSRRNGPLKSTTFYYPAKIFELLSTTAMVMIRNPVFHLARRAARVAPPACVRAPR
jgi:hypothetical protein